MRSFAAFVTRGRIQALAVAILAVGSVYFCWVGAAVVALITLSKGYQQGALILLWASLPAIMQWYQFANALPMMVLLGSFAAAISLAWLKSWRPVLLIASISGLITALLLVTLQADYTDQYVRAYDTLAAQVEKEMASKGQGQIPWFAQLEIGREFIAGKLGAIIALLTVVSIILSRWWQAGLYNPGGFQQEFHQLRLPRYYALVLAAVMIATATSGGAYAAWAEIAAVPFLFCGIGLVHGLVKQRNMAVNWLILFYILLMIASEMNLLVVLLAFLDSLFDFRRRLAKRSS